MGKIVKYCSSCDEGFAERFGFCPNCAAPLQTFALNPVAADETHSQQEFAASADPVSPIEETTEATFADTIVVEDPIDEAPQMAAPEVEEPAIEEPAEIHEVQTAYEPFYQTAPMYADEPSASFEEDYDDGGYHITIVQEKNRKQRNVLLLGSSFLMMTLAIGGTIASLFNKSLGVDAIGDERSIALLLEDVPMVVEDEPEKKKDDKGGGGGGGGREDEEPVSQGDPADQSRTPTRPPDAKVHRSDNFELVTPPPQTEGERKFEKKYDRWGDPIAKFGNLSNGTGSGGGMGSGVGTGQGSGHGTGAGSGSGSGYGSGDGDGDGSGRGSGRGSGDAPPPKPVGVTSPMRIIAKPRAGYTDAARTNNVQGSVRLKVTLLASGAIGSITPVTRLPHGLTEQAIAAARQIRFEPKKVNGQPVSVVQTIEYTFSIY